MSIPFARKISKDFLDDSLADLFEVDLIVGVAEVLVSRLNAKFSVSLFDQLVFFFLLFFCFFDFLVGAD